MRDIAASPRARARVEFRRLAFLRFMLCVCSVTRSVFAHGTRGSRVKVISEDGISI